MGTIYHKQVNPNIETLAAANVSIFGITLVAAANVSKYGNISSCYHPQPWELRQEKSHVNVLGGRTMTEGCRTKKGKWIISEHTRTSIFQFYFGDSMSIHPREMSVLRASMKELEDIHQGDREDNRKRADIFGRQWGADVSHWLEICSLPSIASGRPRNKLPVDSEWRNRFLAWMNLQRKKPQWQYRQKPSDNNV